jgi:hypothetical protein
VDVGATGVRDAAVVGLDHEPELSQLGERERGGKRKRGMGFEEQFVKGEAGFLRRAQEAGVKVIKAPRGMSRSKANGSKWHIKWAFPPSLQPCLPGYKQ